MKIKSGNLITLITFLLILFIPGCATLNIHHYERTARRPAHIVDFYESLDDAVESELVGDASHLRIRGFPNFRADRFLVALKEHINDDQKREAWIELLRQSDIESREKEIRNLSEASVQHLAGKFDIVPDRANLIHRVKEYSAALARHDRTNDQFFETLKQSVKDPGEYSFF